MGNKKYKGKRDFSKIGEPRGDTRKKQEDSGPIFVIQKHDATNLHYDFRLGIGGTVSPKAASFKNMPRPITPILSSGLP